MRLFVLSALVASVAAGSAFAQAASPAIHHGRLIRPVAPVAAAPAAPAADTYAAAPGKNRAVEEHKAKGTKKHKKHAKKKAAKKVDAAAPAAK